MVSAVIITERIFRFRINQNRRSDIELTMPLKPSVRAQSDTMEQWSFSIGWNPKPIGLILFQKLATERQAHVCLERTAIIPPRLMSAHNETEAPQEDWTVRSRIYHVIRFEPGMSVDGILVVKGAGANSLPRNWIPPRSNGLLPFVVKGVVGFNGFAGGCS